MLPKIIIGVIVLIIAFTFIFARNQALLIFTSFDNKSPENPISNTVQKTESSKPPIFTEPIFDPSLIKNITPLGELMGGYEEAQALAGVMINIKPEALSGRKEIEVRAPTDMHLLYYAFFKSPVDNEESWTLIFKLSQDIELKFDHITSVSQKIIDATTSNPSQSSAEQSPKKEVSLKAGEVFAHTSGTSMAHNWNIYLIDKSYKNNFIKPERYSNERAAQRLYHGRCVFDFYQDNLKQQFINLMGYNKAGQAKDCGSISKDVAGTISGMWHLDKNPGSGISEKLDGIYASPLSVFKNSAGQVTIDQVDNKRLDIEPENPTNKDPEEIKTEHCYQLSSGYAYFKIISDTQMQFSYSNSSSCPAIFPEAQSKTYYR